MNQSLKKTKLSVNLNKVALLRNSRGANFPNLMEVVSLVIKSGCDGITLHPRFDERHATLADVQTLMESNEIRSNNIEINVEGDPRDDLIEFLYKIKVHQFTIVPVTQGERTTTRGWRDIDDELMLRKAIKQLKQTMRISIFVEPDEEAVSYVKSFGVDAVEFHTKHYASSFMTSDQENEINKIKTATAKARELGLRVHLGHDLNLVNLSALISEVQPDEVSIGHALIVESLLRGLPSVVTDYKKICSN